jgi:hypothetical protein
MEKNTLIASIAALTALAVAITKLADFLLCSNDADKEKWKNRLLGDTWSRLDELTFPRWPQTAADRFSALITATVGDAFVDARPIVVSFSISILAMFLFLPAAAWFNLLIGVGIAGICYLISIPLFFAYGLLFQIGALKRLGESDAFLIGSLIGVVLIVCAAAVLVMQTTGWIVGSRFAVISGIAATMNMIFDLVSIYITRSLVQRIRQSDGWTQSLSYWAVDVVCCVLIAVTTFITIDYLETLAGVPRREFVGQFQGTPSSFPFAMTGVLPTALHVLLFLLTLCILLWEGIRHVSMVVLFKAWERDASPFSQIGGGILVLGGIALAFSKLLL